MTASIGLNFLNHRAVPNLVIARIGTNGRVSIYNKGGTANIVADQRSWPACPSKAAPARVSGRVQVE